MKISKIFAGMSAAAIMATMLAAMPASAADAEAIGTAYIAFGADSKYVEPVTSGETNEGKIELTGWTWGDDSETWGHYATITAPDFTSDNQTVKEAYDKFMVGAKEGETPTSVTLTGDKPFGFGYNDLKGKWQQDNKPTLDEATGLYTLTITDMDLSYDDTEGAENKFGGKFFDPDWGWGSKDVTEINVTWTLNYGGEKTGSWNTFYYADGDSSEDVTQESVPVYLDEEFVVEAQFAQDIAHMWFVAPTVVFNEKFDDTFADKYDVTVALEIDGKKVDVDATVKKDDDGNVVLYWAEDTGSNSKANTARLYGGYNEWADQFVEETVFENAKDVKYYVTISEKEEEPEPVDEPKETTKPTETTKTEGTGTTTGNPKTAAVLGLGAIALAGAAAVVAKKRD